ncbi:GH92 family glycosyl hydrolase [Vibrio mimicus]|uniref:GH92 family glycosyl hydrolase n=1 Tax=Vibrio mimicus TaxID=674 RepID=UPI00076B7DC6|nr:GH92 family glycosyl hydrolase [Vibrio mimicus]AMG04788.1 glycoside hydrolase family 92 protein [Vibrio mimicus]KAA3493480.1 glycoside hydrolase family 92 protein [Vibrio mimicus]
MRLKPSLLACTALSGLISLTGCNEETISSNTEQDIKMGVHKPVVFDDMNITRYVNPFIGTANLGNTYPGATTPHGMVQLSPNNGSLSWESTAGYYYHDTRIAGFTHTHLSGAGLTDLKDILVMPINSRSDYKINNSLNLEASRYRHEDEQATAGYYKVELINYGIKAELTASDRVGVHRFTFPQDEKSEIVINLGADFIDSTADTALSWDKDNNRIEGYRFSYGWAPSQKEFFVMEFNQPIKNIKFSYYDEAQERYVDAQKSTTENNENNHYARAYVEFDTSAAGLTVETKVALSNVEIGKEGKSGASLNMTEVAGMTFDDVRKAATKKWEDELDKITVSGDKEYKQTFYTALYHTYLGQTIHSDRDGRYRQVHQGSAQYPDGTTTPEGKVINSLKESIRTADANKDGKADFTRYDTFSLWDTYRVVQPLSSILEPDRLSDVVLSMLSYAEEQWVDDQGNERKGRLPQWTLKGNETSVMLGMHSTPVIHDAISKGSLDKRMIALGFTDAERQEIKERLVNAMVADARASTSQGVPHIKDYEKLGYVPAYLTNNSEFSDKWTTSYALEYAMNDWAIAQTIKVVFDENDPRYKEFADRSNNWQTVFDFGGRDYKGWFKVRDTAGKFVDSDWVDPKTGKALNKDWRPDLFDWGFAESNGWHYSFSVQHDISGLIDLMTRFDKTQNPQATRGKLFTKRLDEYWTTYPDLDMGNDHSTSKFNTGIVGQHVQGNEPEIHIPYLYNYVGQPWKSQEVIVKATNVCYQNIPGGLCGNDDFGALSGWFVFRALGFFPVNASSGIYEIGTPMFETASINVGNDQKFTITAENVSRANIYIQSARLNGEELNRTYLTHDEILSGGELEFVMGEQPNQSWGSQPEDLPPAQGIGTFLHEDKMPAGSR